MQLGCLHKLHMVNLLCQRLTVNFQTTSQQGRILSQLKSKLTSTSKANLILIINLLSMRRVALEYSMCACVDPPV